MPYDGCHVRHIPTAALYNRNRAFEVGILLRWKGTIPRQYRLKYYQTFQPGDFCLRRSTPFA